MEQAELTKKHLISSSSVADFSIAPVSGVLGARVEGIDLAKDLDASTMARLREAYLEHLVLVFPGQGHLTPRQQVAFAARWGKLHRMPEGTPCLDDLPELLVLDFKGRPPPTDKWHSDMSMEACPPMGSALLCRTIPVGGDTIFANQYLAYESLSDAMKNLLNGLNAVHTPDVFARSGSLDPSNFPTSIHPVVRKHPETGRKALYVNSVFTRYFEGMTLEESKPLLNWLCEHSVHPNFTFRHHWSAGDLIFWDNRCLQHFAVADYGSAQRTTHRVTILGNEPPR